MHADIADARGSGLDLARHGAAYAPGAAADLLDSLDALAQGTAPDQAGQRMTGAPLQALTAPGTALHGIVAAQLGPAAQAVRALLFDKSDATNWALGWHQDRTIVVRERHDVQGFGPWTVKAGRIHVAPPADLLARMITIRVHLDDVPADNAPLLIAPGSHRLGRIAEPDIADTVARCGMLACHAARGDIWLYATPILHGSQRAAAGMRRRVLQLDFAAEALPQPLQWLGV